MKSDPQEYLVVCARLPEGVNEDTAPLLLNAVRQSGAAQHDFIQTGTFNVFFPASSKESKSQAASLVGTLKDLRQSDSRYTELQIGTASGLLTLDDSMPVIGKTVNEALDAAMGDRRDE